MTLTSGLTQLIKRLGFEKIATDTGPAYTQTVYDLTADAPKVATN